MSITLMSKVWDLRLTTAQQGVLMCMADHAWDDGTHCFPSVGRIAYKTGYTERHVQRVIRQLEEAGLLILVENASGGRGKPREYTICLEKGDIKSPFQKKGDTRSPNQFKRVTSEPERVTSETERVTPESPEPLEPSYNHSPQKPPGGAVHSGVDENNGDGEPQDFQQFWTNYPWRHGRADAARAYRAALADGASPKEILSGVTHYRLNKPEGVNWLAPARWLKRRLWQDADPADGTDTAQMVAGPDWWKRIADRMAIRIGERAVRSWFNDVELKTDQDAIGRILHVLPPTRFHADRIKSDYWDALATAAKAEGFIRVTIMEQIRTLDRGKRQGVTA